MCSQAADGYWDVCDQVIAKQKLGKGAWGAGPRILAPLRKKQENNVYKWKNKTQRIL